MSGQSFFVIHVDIRTWKTLCGWESELTFWIAHGSLWDSPTSKNASVEYISSYAILTTIFWVKTQSKVTSHATLCNMDGHKCLFEIQYLWKLCVMPWSLVTHSYRLDCPSWFGMCNFFAYSGQMMVTKHRVYQ